VFPGYASRRPGFNSRSLKYGICSGLGGNAPFFVSTSDFFSLAVPLPAMLLMHTFVTLVMDGQWAD
jgi:hypothetical protein